MASGPAGKGFGLREPVGLVATTCVLCDHKNTSAHFRVVYSLGLFGRVTANLGAHQIDGGKCRSQCSSKRSVVPNQFVTSERNPKQPKETSQRHAVCEETDVECSV